jgi:hypothetical protein
MSEIVNDPLSQSVISCFLRPESMNFRYLDLISFCFVLAMAQPLPKQSWKPAGRLTGLRNWGSPLIQCAVFATARPIRAADREFRCSYALMLLLARRR